MSAIGRKLRRLRADSIGRDQLASPTSGATRHGCSLLGGVGGRIALVVIAERSHQRRSATGSTSGPSTSGSGQPTACDEHEQRTGIRDAEHVDRSQRNGGRSRRHDHRVVSSRSSRSEVFGRRHRTVLSNPFVPVIFRKTAQSMSFAHLRPRIFDEGRSRSPSTTISRYSSRSRATRRNPTSTDAQFQSPRDLCPRANLIQFGFGARRGFGCPTDRSLYRALDRAAWGDARPAG